MCSDGVPEYCRLVTCTQHDIFELTDFLILLREVAAEVRLSISAFQISVFDFLPIGLPVRFSDVD